MNHGNYICKIGLMVAYKKDMLFLGKSLRFSVPEILVLLIQFNLGKVSTPIIEISAFFKGMICPNTSRLSNLNLFLALCVSVEEIVI
jgi:hypothetical protein